MKKVIKIAEARVIAKNNPQLDADDLIWGIGARFNKTINTSVKST